MHAHNPDNDAAPGPAGGDNPCLLGTGRSSADPGNIPTLQGREQHLPDKNLLFRPVRNVLRNTGLPGTSPQTSQETSRKMWGRAFRNVPNPGSVDRSHSPDRSFRAFFRPRIRQQDSFRDNRMVHIEDPGLWINEPGGRPGQGELRIENVRRVQVFWRADWPKTSCNRWNTR